MYLNGLNELVVLDTVTMQTTEVVDLTSKLVYATFARQANGSPLDEARSYSNSFQSADGALYLLGQLDLKKAEVPNVNPNNTPSLYIEPSQQP